MLIFLGQLATQSIICFLLFNFLLGEVIKNSQKMSVSGGISTICICRFYIKRLKIVKKLAMEGYIITYMV